jgi:hypothetical protein
VRPPIPRLSRRTVDFAERAHCALLGGLIEVVLGEREQFG